MLLCRLAATTALLVAFAAPAAAEGLRVTYPSDGHVTTADRIFFVGTAAPGGAVTLNGAAVHRSPAGHFAPSLPLQVGPNRVTLRHGAQALSMTITRRPAQPAPPTGAAFALGALAPALARAVQPGEPVVFSAVAPAGATVAVRVGGRTIALAPQPASSALPDNKAGLTDTNRPTARQAVRYAASASFQAPGRLGRPIYSVAAAGQRREEPSAGTLEVLRPEVPAVVEVKAEEGVARTGASTDHSRLAPLPRGTRAAVTGRQGDWLRLAHGAWIAAAETQPLVGAVPPRTIVRSLRARQVPGLTEIVIPLEQPVPASIEEGDGTLTLTLHHAIAQTDIVRLNDDPLVRRLDWAQVGPDRIAYTFRLKSPQAWGWTLRYDGPSLVLGLRHRPPASRDGRLDGLRVVLDAGHGGRGDEGTHGPTGLAEKDLTLPLTRLTRAALEARGATVHLTRDADLLVGLVDRTEQIARVAPHVAISLHYNALPDQGDAENTRGVGAFWYHPQAHSLARALHDTLTTRLARPSYGIWWDNLALARPHAAPAVLMEIGFLTNPEEFEWCVDPAEQRKVAEALAEGLAAWLAEQPS